MVIRDSKKKLVENEKKIFDHTSSKSKLINGFIFCCSSSGVEERDESDEEESIGSPLINWVSNEPLVSAELNRSYGIIDLGRINENYMFRFVVYFSFNS
jgi:hypothetical protein